MSTRSKESFLRHLNAKSLKKIISGETPVSEDNNSITIPIELYCNLYKRITELEQNVKRRKKK